MNDQTKFSKVETTASAFDMVNAFLIASIAVVGTLVTVLFLIWLTMLLANRTTETLFIPDTSFGNEKPEGFADDVYEPGVEEFPEVDVPQLADAIEATSEAVSTVRANLEARDGDAQEMGKGKGFGSREGGPGTGNSKIVPEHKRWKVEYDTPDINKYASQLAFFNIDIGVVSNTSNDVIRLTQPGPGASIVQTDRAAEKSSLYFVHEKVQLRRWDEALFKRKQSIDMAEKFSVQFYPESLRQILRSVEGGYLQSQGKDLADVRRTRFKVIEGGNGFAFEVAEVDYQ